MNSINKSETLNNLRENLRILEERISEYIETVDIPLQYIKERKRLIREIANVESEYLSNEQIDILQKASILLDDFEEIMSKLVRQGWNEECITEIDIWIDTIEINIGSFNNSSELDFIKNKQSLQLILNNANKILKKYKNATEYFETHSVSSSFIYTEISAPTKFTDRVSILTNLKEQFKANQIIIIAGVGGVGKTYLTKKFINQWC